MLNDNFSFFIVASPPPFAEAPDTGVARSPFLAIARNQRGVALMFVVLFLALLSFSWLAFTYYSSYEEGMIRNQVRSDQAAYLAEAGVQQALYFLSQDWDWQHWAANRWGEGGALDPTGTYYQWTGDLGETGKTYTVQIRSDGVIQSRIQSTGTVTAPGGAASPSSRRVEVEIGSPFDCGIYSHRGIEFRTGTFTVSGPVSNGYVYSRDGITNPTLLFANRVTGNYTSAPLFFPKTIPLPELGAVSFSAQILGTPGATLVTYTGDSGETSLEKGALLYNRTRDNFRRISPTVSPDQFNNRITTESGSGDGWAAGDAIELRRIALYENNWTTLSQEMDNFNSPPHAAYDRTYDCAGFSGTIASIPSSYTLLYTNGLNTARLAVGAVLINKNNGGTRTITSFDTGSQRISIDSSGGSIYGWSAGQLIEMEEAFKPDIGNPWRTGAGRQEFPVSPDTTAEFQPGTLGTVTFYGDTTFNGTVKINGNAVFGRRYDSGLTAYGSVTIDGDLIVLGNVYCLNQIEVNGRLYVTGSVRVEDHISSYGVDSYPDNVHVYESISDADGILIERNGGLFIRTGSLYIEKNGQDTDLISPSGTAYAGIQINDYCYVYSDTTILANTNSVLPPNPVISLPFDPTTTHVLYVRNGSLTIGSSTYLQGLSGCGNVISGVDVNISSTLRADLSAQPMRVLAMRDMELRGTIGNSSATPFCGVLYSGGTLSRPSGITPSADVRGLIAASQYSTFFHGGTVVYEAQRKADLATLGFVNTKDFARPLLWAETTP